MFPFPEGEIARQEELAPFRPGVERALASNPVPTVPLVLRGMWGSFFSRAHGGKGMSKPFPRRVFSKIEVEVGEIIPGEEASVKLLEEKTKEMLAA